MCGSEEGTLTIWDIRQPAFPASYYTVHENTSVSDIAFHHTDPTKLFTSSESGELFQWSHKVQQITERIDGQLAVVENENINPWLCGQRTKSRINVNLFLHIFILFENDQFSIILHNLQIFIVSSW